MGGKAEVTGADILACNGIIHVINEVLTPTPWSKCTEAERRGDFNGLNGFTLGDAVYVAQAWTGEEPTPCMGGDLNQLNGFTLGDAVYVAQVWSELLSFKWPV